MRQDIIDDVRKDYEDMGKMISTNFSEMDDKDVTVGRYRKIRKFKNLYWQWLSENLDIDDCVLKKAIKDNRADEYIGKTNNILMYIAEMHYGTYEKLFDLNELNRNPDELYVLYVDIENEHRYMVKKEDQEEFEKTHQVIVTYKNPNVNAGWNFEKNYDEIQSVKNEFIRKAMYSTQEEATKQFIKKYPVTDKVTIRY